MTQAEFEALLTSVVGELNGVIADDGVFRTSGGFESAVKELLAERRLPVPPRIHPYVFPDIPLGRFGVEVKFTEKDTWRSVANSIFEGMRDASVESVYMLCTARWGAIRKSDGASTTTASCT